jgi:hypothetical protein
MISFSVVPSTHRNSKLKKKKKFEKQKNEEKNPKKK